MDRLHATTVILVCTIGQIFAIFVLWGLTNGQAMFYVFAIVIGIFGGAVPAVWAGCVASIKNALPTNAVDTSFILALLVAGRGLGAIIGGPLSSALLRARWHMDAKAAYGSEYAALIVFVGMSSLLGGAACVGRLLRLV